MSFSIFSGLSASNTNENDKSFEMIKYITEKDTYTSDYSTFFSSKECIIGYITSKYVQNIKEIGCYIIMVNSQIKEGPNAIFCISRSDRTKDGSINKLISSEGKLGDKLDILWNPLEYPCIKLTHNFTKELLNNKHLKFSYNIRVISI
jgi:hypothetical protein